MIPLLKKELESCGWKLSHHSTNTEWIYTKELRDIGLQDQSKPLWKEALLRAIIRFTEGTDITVVEWILKNNPVLSFTEHKRIPL
jgi:hypothetical protein